MLHRINRILMKTNVSIVRTIVHVCVTRNIMKDTEFHIFGYWYTMISESHIASCHIRAFFCEHREVWCCVKPGSNLKYIRASRNNRIKNPHRSYSPGTCIVSWINSSDYYHPYYSRDLPWFYFTYFLHSYLLCKTNVT